MPAVCVSRSEIVIARLAGTIVDAVAFLHGHCRLGEGRDEVAHGLVEIDLAILDQHHDRSTGNRFGLGGKSKDRVRRHAAAGFLVAPTDGAFVDGPCHRGARAPPLRERDFPRCTFPTPGRYARVRSRERPRSAAIAGLSRDNAASENAVTAQERTSELRTAWGKVKAGFMSGTPLAWNVWNASGPILSPPARMVRTRETACVRAHSSKTAGPGGPARFWRTAPQRAALLRHDRDRGNYASSGNNPDTDDADGRRGGRSELDRAAVCHWSRANWRWSVKESCPLAVELFDVRANRHPGVVSYDDVHRRRFRREVGDGAAGGKAVRVIEGEHEAALARPPGAPPLLDRRRCGRWRIRSRDLSIRDARSRLGCLAPGCRR